MLARDAIFTAIDFETTGHVPGWPNEPWQIGLCEIVGGAIGQTFSSFLRVDLQRPFNRNAPGRHAALRHELAASPSLPEIWEAVSPWLAGRPLVAHNIGTERTQLRLAAPLLGPVVWIDTLKLARHAYPGLSSYALEDLVAQFGLEKGIRAKCPGLAPHDALYDAVACGAFLLHLLGGKGWEEVEVENLAAL